MTAYSRYSAYQPSGVDWLGDIPGHWQLRRLKSVISNAINGAWGDDPKGDRNDLICVRVADFDYDHLKVSFSKLTLRNIDPSLQVTRLLNMDDLLIEKSGGGDIWSVGRVVNYTLTEKAICSNFIARLTANHEVNKRFLCYTFAAMYTVHLNERSIKQTTGIQNLDLYSYLCERFGLPPLSEQRVIVAFLDRETARIDALITKKQELIDLLSKKRIALISHAVTKGLNPAGPMKDSRIEWLGKVPEGWEVLKLKYVSSIRYGLGQPPPEKPDGIPFVRATNINSGRITENGMLYIENTNTVDSRNARLRKDEIIVVRSGAYTGDSAIVPGKYEGAIAGYDMVVKMQSGASSFMAWQFLCPFVRDFQFGLSSLRAAQPHLNAEELGNTLVIFPSIDEQRAIADFLNRETAHIDEMAAKIQESIRLLKKQRTSLISAAVTGKIDVRQ